MHDFETHNIFNRIIAFRRDATRSHSPHPHPAPPKANHIFIVYISFCLRYAIKINQSFSCISFCFEILSFLELILFKRELSTNADIFYYVNQFWGEKRHENETKNVSKNSFFHAMFVIILIF